MTEKIMIIETGFAGTRITTVDGTKRNLVKNYEVDNRSFYELAKRVYKRFEDEKYDRVIVDAYGAGIGLLDQLIPLFEKGDYSYDSKTGKVSKKGSITFNATGISVSSGIWNGVNISGREEF